MQIFSTKLISNHSKLDLFHVYGQLHILQMGSMMTFDDCCMQSQQKNQIIGIAVNSSPPHFKDILNKHINDLHWLSHYGQEKTIQMEGLQVTYQLRRIRSIEDGCDSISGDWQIIILQRKQQMQLTTLGMIISSRGYFIGQFKGKKAHGQGFFFVPQSSFDERHTIKGKWQHNQAIQLSIYPNNSVVPQLTINFLDGNKQAKLTLPNRTTYLGSIRFSGCKNIEEIMTGKGVINFPSKDVYMGSVKNGLMHTQEYQNGVYTCKASRTSYSGSFKDGFREGEGVLTFECMGEMMSATCNWSKGQLTQCLSIDRKANSHKLILPLDQDQPTLSQS